MKVSYPAGGATRNAGTNTNQEEKTNNTDVAQSYVSESLSLAKIVKPGDTIGVSNSQETVN